MSQFKITADSGGLNQALFEVTHGLYVLTAVRDGKSNGQCLDAAMQITNAPPRITIGVGKKSLTHEMILATGKFVLNAIDREDEAAADVVRRFGFQSGRKVDKFADFPYEEGKTGRRSSRTGRRSTSAQCYQSSRSILRRTRCLSPRSIVPEPRKAESR